MLSMHSILVSVAAGGPLTFDSQLKKRGSIPCCSSLLLACVQTSPPIRKKLETGLLLPFFPKGSRGKVGGGGSVCTQASLLFSSIPLCPVFRCCFVMFFVFLKKMNREHQRRAAGQPFYSVG